MNASKIAAFTTRYCDGASPASVTRGGGAGAAASGIREIGAGAASATRSAASLCGDHQSHHTLRHTALGV